MLSGSGFISIVQHLSWWWTWKIKLQWSARKLSRYCSSFINQKYWTFSASSFSNEIVSVLCHSKLNMFLTVGWTKQRHVKTSDWIKSSWIVLLDEAASALVISEVCRSKNAFLRHKKTRSQTENSSCRRTLPELNTRIVIYTFEYMAIHKKVCKTATMMAAFGDGFLCGRVSVSSSQMSMEVRSPPWQSTLNLTEQKLRVSRLEAETKRLTAQRGPRRCVIKIEQLSVIRWRWRPSPSDACWASSHDNEQESAVGCSVGVL